jgi:hypothetical protein
MKMMVSHKGGEEERSMKMMVSHCISFLHLWAPMEDDDDGRERERDDNGLW